MLAGVPDTMIDAAATLIVTAGHRCMNLQGLGGIGCRRARRGDRSTTDRAAREAVAKALGANPVILTGTRDDG